MHSWINKDGNLVKTRTIKEFATLAGLRETNARSLACGYVKKFKNWCSTHRRAKRCRDRFTTVLMNSKSGERCILGQSVAAFARAHNLCKNELYKLINGRKFMYRHWCLEDTLKLAHS